METVEKDRSQLAAINIYNFIKTYTHFENTDKASPIGPWRKLMEVRTDGDEK